MALALAFDKVSVLRFRREIIIIIIILTLIGRPDPTGPAHKGADTAG